MFPLSSWGERAFAELAGSAGGSGARERSAGARGAARGAGSARCQAIRGRAAAPETRKVTLDVRPRCRRPFVVRRGGHFLSRRRLFRSRRLRRMTRRPRRTTRRPRQMARRLRRMTRRLRWMARRLRRMARRLRRTTRRLRRMTRRGLFQGSPAPARHSPEVFPQQKSISCLSGRESAPAQGNS